MTVQFRRGDTVRPVREGEYPSTMYVLEVAPNGITTDSWDEIDPAELALVKPVEEKYDTLLNSIGHALKERRAS